MQNDSIAILLSSWQDKIPLDGILYLKDELSKIPEDKMPLFSSIPLKSPIIGLILGFFLGVLGIDRFYKGDMILGFAKLFLTLTYFGLSISSIWAIVDLFLVWKGIKKDNLAKIQECITTL